MSDISGQYKAYQVYNLILILGGTALLGFSNRFSSLYYSDFMCLFVLAGSIMVWFLVKFKHHATFFARENVLYLVMIVAGIVVAHYKFKLTWHYTLKEAIFPITTLVSYYVMTMVYNNPIKIERFKKAIVIGSSIASVFALMVSVLLRMGIDLAAVGKFLKERNGLPRFSFGTTFVVIGFFISYIELKHGNRSRRYIFNIIINAINILFVIQTRTMILYIILSIIGASLISKKDIKRKLRIAAIVITAFFVILLNVADYLALNTDYYAGDAGIRVRFEAISHYWNYFKENPIFGVGFLTVSDDMSINTIINGARGHYNTSDVGLFGFLMQHGIVGIIWLWLWFTKIIKTYSRFRTNVNSKQSNLILILIMYYLITLINLMFNAHPLFLNTPILMLLVQSMFYNTSPLGLTDQMNGVKMN